VVREGERDMEEVAKREGGEREKVGGRGVGGGREGGVG